MTLVDSSTLKTAGITVPPTDAIIAASALETGAILIHKDSHFEQIAQYFPLLTDRSLL
ncbi:MAG TPA: PIN domain-containing protein [Spirochaetales bacterium]|nr:PIN domain-containing protein [Spirochaetales bacterium]